MDHHRVTISSSAASCGILELSNITDPAGAAFQLASYLYHPARGNPAAFILMSDIAYVDEGSTQKLAQILRYHGAVDFDMTRGVENPKTGNHIQVWIGTINHEVFKAWYKTERIARIQKQG